MTDRVAGIVEAVRLRVEEELRQQLESLAADHARALDEVRRAAQQEAQDAESRWSALLTGARTELQQQVETAVTAARLEFEAEREGERRTIAEAAAPLRHLSDDLDRCTSLSEVLNQLARAVAIRPGGALFVSRHGTFEPWREPGGPSSGLPLGWEGLVDPAVRERTVQRQRGNKAVPVAIDRTVVAVVVSPETGANDLAPEVIACAGAARLTAVTAGKLAQAGQWLRPVGTPADVSTAAASVAPGRADADNDPEQSARRYARLLISEIKLYNETAVREGRAHRDLGQRLGAEITRARQTYEARVSPDLPGRAKCFQEELVRTLADGDASLLS